MGDTACLDGGMEQIAGMGTMTLSHFASFDGTKLAVHREGAGRPVILLHGLFSSAHMNWTKWGHHTRLAEAGFEAIMLDFRVHGESDAGQRDPRGGVARRDPRRRGPDGLRN